MDWDGIGRDSLQSARRSHGMHSRSAVSRAYYAAHSVLTHALVDAGYQLAANRQTPPHAAQPNLIGVHLALRGRRFVQELRSRVRRLYAARLDADYNQRVTIDQKVSLQAIRDAYSIFLMLEVQP
jgi:hypothetical protein